MSDETPQEKAFRDSEDQEFLGRRLNPFTLTLQRAAKELGLRYKTGRLQPGDIREISNPEFIVKRDAEEQYERLQKGKKKGAKIVEEMKRLSEIITARRDAPETMTNYAGIEEDAAIVVYLMDHPESLSYKIRRQSDAERLGAFDRWSEVNGLGLGGPNVGAALEVFMSTMNGLNVSSGTPQYEHSEEIEDDDPNE